MRVIGSSIRPAPLGATLAAAALLGSATSLPLGATAPHPSPDDAGVTCALGSTGSDAVRAEALRDRARALLRAGRTSHWSRAAGLLERAAALSEPCSTETIRSLRLAGRLHYAVGDLRRSREALRRAARHSLATGRVAEAGHMLLDAAQVALDMGERESAREALERVELLVLSPDVTPRQRERVLARIDPEVARTAMRRR